MGLQRVVKGQMKITDTYAEVKSLRGKRKPAKEAIKDENVLDKIDNPVDDRKGVTAKHVEPEGSGVAQAKRALYACAPVNLPRRAKEIQEVYEFVSGHIFDKTSGSIYISGAPGTGKTAVVQHVLKTLENPSESHPDYEDICDIKFVNVYINCMNVNTRDIFNHILGKLNSKSKTGDAYERLATRVTSKQGKSVILILDEMDQILTTAKDVLYKIFELARLPGSRLVLIGIANSLDLTVRHLPMLGASPKSLSPKPRTPAGIRALKAKETPVNASPFQGCKLMQFPPYEREDIEEILASRIEEVGSQVFEAGAIKFVAAKVASTTGDIRKALNACQKALDMCVKDQRPALKTTTDDGFNASSPKKVCLRDDRIGIVVMSKAIAPQRDEGGLPLQQKIILATLLKINKDARSNMVVAGDGVSSPIPLNTFYDTYRKICSDKGLSWIDRSELSSVCGLLEDRSLIHLMESSGTLKRSKNGKTKSGIFIQPDSLLKQLGSDPLVASIVN